MGGLVDNNNKLIIIVSKISSNNLIIKIFFLIYERNCHYTVLYYNTYNFDFNVNFKQIMIKVSNYLYYK